MTSLVMDLVMSHDKIDVIGDVSATLYLRVDDDNFLGEMLPR